MTPQEAKEILAIYRFNLIQSMSNQLEGDIEALDMAIKALEQQPNRCNSCIHSDERDGSNCYECVKGMADNFEAQPIDKSAMMYEIYMEGVNMGGEYQGCWVRFKDIEKIVDKYIEG